MSEHGAGRRLRTGAFLGVAMLLSVGALLLVTPLAHSWTDQGDRSGYGYGYEPREPRGPGAPTDVTAVARSRRILVRWQAPDDLGDGGRTTYRVDAFPGRRTVFTDRRRVTFRHLDPCCAYRFVVTASNEAGEGPPSEPSNAVRPRRPRGGWWRW